MGMSKKEIEEYLKEKVKETENAKKELAKKEKHRLEMELEKELDEEESLDLFKKYEKVEMV